MTESFKADPYALTEEELAMCRQLAPTAQRFSKATRNPDAGVHFTFYFRNPTRAEFKMFRQLLAKDGEEIEAFEKLALTLVIKPTEGEFLSLLNDWPGLVNNSLQEAVGKLAGLSDDERSKK